MRGSSGCAEGKKGAKKNRIRHGAPEDLYARSRSVGDISARPVLYAAATITDARSCRRLSAIIRAPRDFNYEHARL